MNTRRQFFQTLGTALLAGAGSKPAIALRAAVRCEAFLNGTKIAISARTLASAGGAA